MQNQGSRENNLDEIILRNSPSPSTALLIVSEWYSQDRYDEVIKACKDMLRLYPDHVQLHRLACLAHSAMDFDRQALEETEEIMRIIENFADIYLLRAKILNRLNQTRKALEALGVYLAYRPGDETGLALLEELGKTSRSEGPPDQESSGVDLDPAAAMASSTIAELYLSQGLVDEAVKTYRHVVALHPDDDNSRRRLKELQAGGKMVQENKDRATQFSAEYLCRTVLEQWREKCRKCFDTGVLPGE
ncbi:MAG TPA: tetratricopeptide repeat protein [Desulfobacteraceae bacterium]|nr:tetratricopeptide repeat protein [Desulfobacteraceae bacterium]